MSLFMSLFRPVYLSWIGMYVFWLLRVVPALPLIASQMSLYSRTLMASSFAACTFAIFRKLCLSALLVASFSLGGDPESDCPAESPSPRKTSVCCRDCSKFSLLEALSDSFDACPKNGKFCLFFLRKSPFCLSRSLWGALVQ